LREELRHREFEKRVLRKIFGPNWGEVTVDLRKLYTRSLMICTDHQIFFG
jgi:hypothetical protein